MDMVVNAGKSRKNVEAFVLLPPDARRAIDLLIDTRAQVGVPSSNVYIFARLNADSPMAGHTELQELAQACGELKFPERITSRKLRTYIATVSQVLCNFMHLVAVEVLSALLLVVWYNVQFSDVSQNLRCSA